MTLVTRRVVAPLVFLLVAASSCTTKPKERAEPIAVAPAEPIKEAPAVLPDPLPLPETPRAAIWLAEPAQTMVLVNALSTGPVSLDDELRGGLARIVAETWAESIAAAVDREAPWAVIDLEGEGEIVSLPLTAEGRATLEKAFEALPKEGSFGAVLLPASARVRDGKAKYLAWIDPKGGLAIAKSLPGLVTTRELARTYGKTPIYFTASESNLELDLPAPLPIERVTGRGDLSTFEVRAQMKPGSGVLEQLQLGEGTLSGLLGDERIALGATTRWTGHADAVQEVIRGVDRQVEQLPFLVKGMASEIQKKLNTALRSWDGRVLVAAGGEAHVRLAYGSGDPKRSGVAVTRLIDEVRGNVDVLRMFTSDVPKIALRYRAGEGGGQPVHLLTLSSVQKHVPKDFHGLLDKRGNLQVAMAWSERAGGGLLVVGPEPVKELSAWLDTVAQAPSGRDTAGQLGALTIALPPEQLAAISSGVVDVDTVVGLRGDGPRFHIAAERTGPDELKLELRAPAERPGRKPLATDPRSKPG